MSLTSNLIGLKVISEIKPSGWIVVVAMIYIGFLISDSPILLILYILGCIAFVLVVLILPEVWHKRDITEAQEASRSAMARARAQDEADAKAPKTTKEADPYE